MNPFDNELRDGQWNSQIFDTIGDESGSIEMNVDGSVTPVNFYVTAPSDHVYYIWNFNGKVEDVGNFEANTFGNLSKLTVGCGLFLTDNQGFIRELTNQHKIRDNSDWGVYAYDTSIMDLNVGTGPAALHWSFDLHKEGAPFKLLNGWSLYWQVADDLTGLESFHIRAGMVSVPTKYL